MAVVRINGVYHPSENVVAREIEGELIIVPLTSGFGDLEDELYSLNETGRAIWRLLDGERNLAQVVDLLAAEYQAPVDKIQQDVVGLVEILVGRGILDAD